MIQRVVVMGGGAASTLSPQPMLVHTLNCACPPYLHGRPHKRTDDHVLAVSTNAALILVFLAAMLLKQFEDVEDEVRCPVRIFLNCV